MIDLKKMKGAAGSTAMDDVLLMMVGASDCI
jgi:hypothetical protein